MTAERPAHSPLGASSAERWIKCPGSVTFIKELDLTEVSDEPDYRRNGTAAHEAIAKCLTEGLDAWEVIGFVTSNGVTVDVEITDAIQLFLDTVRPSFKDADQILIERGISAPIHELFYGTVDCAVVYEEFAGAFDEESREVYLPCLDVNDYKHGEGITVDVEWNPQVLYYAYGILEDTQLPDDTRVRMRIVQPRGFHHDGPVRTFELTAGEVRAWATGILRPAMIRTENDRSLDGGPWCRFCPAKLVCPMLTGLFRAAATCDPKVKVDTSTQALALNFQHIGGVKFYIKALEDELYARLNKGETNDLVKLVHKKANRVWNVGADAIMREKLGAEAVWPPELKSPAEIEKLGPAAKALVKEYAYTPESGLTVALADDNRVGVKVQTTTEIFGAAVAALGKETAS
jgi:hypothetical protein